MAKRFLTRWRYNITFLEASKTRDEKDNSKFR
jgi:hypothetical protein